MFLIDLTSQNTSGKEAAGVLDQVLITVDDTGFPTVITPNNDGFNDFLEFPGIDLQPGSERQRPNQRFKSVAR